MKSCRSRPETFFTEVLVTEGARICFFEDEKNHSARSGWVLCPMFLGKTSFSDRNMTKFRENAPFGAETLDAPEIFESIRDLPDTSSKLLGSVFVTRGTRKRSHVRGRSPTRGASWTADFSLVLRHPPLCSQALEPRLRVLSQRAVRAAPWPIRDRQSAAFRAW